MKLSIHHHNKAIRGGGGSAGRSLGFFLSKFVSDICNQTSNISDYGVEV